jgi:hypothetical protein
LTRTQAKLSPLVFNVGVLTASSLVALAIAFVLTAGEFFPRPSTPSPPPSALKMSTPFFMPGLKQPPALPAASAEVPANAEIIGVEAGGRHRAYLITALSRIDSHVVNDLVGEVPITVTFCDRSQCARVFCNEGGSAPMDVNLAGIKDDSLLIRIENVIYHQDSGSESQEAGEPPFPYATHPFVRTTWKAWKESHPLTDVYTGPIAVDGP